MVAMEELRVALQEERQMLHSMAQENMASWRSTLEATFDRLEEELGRKGEAKRPFDLDHQQKVVACLKEDVDPFPPEVDERHVGTTAGVSAFSDFTDISESQTPEENGVILLTYSNPMSEESSPRQHNAEAAATSTPLQRAGPSNPSFEAGKSPGLSVSPHARNVLGELRNLDHGRAGSTKSQFKSSEAVERIGHETYEAIINYTAGVLVLLNSLLMLLELEIEGGAIGKELGMLTDAARMSDVEPVFRFLDGAFVFIFLVELVVRVLLERKNVLSDPAFWFDAFLVAAGLVDMFIILPMIDTDGIGGEPKNIVLLRLVRALKAFRAMRMVRTLRLFKGLRLLVKACQCFLPSLGWAMVLLTVFMSMGALILATLLQDFISNPENPIEDREWVWMRYGTAYHALWTLYEITFAGNWPTNVRPILEKVSHFYVIFFLIYITIIVFAVIRVISAIFLKDTLDAANNDAEQAVVERLQKKKQYVEKLENIFNAIVTTPDGMITEERLAEILENPVVLTYFQTLDVDVHESAALFHLMDNGDGEVTLDEFIGGIMRCKGQARAIDQVAMRADLKALDAKISKVIRALKAADLIPTKSSKSPKASTKGRYDAKL